MTVYWMPCRIGRGWNERRNENQDWNRAWKEYNERKQHGRTACIVEVAEGSFEAYLLERLDKKYRLAKEAIDEALDAIEEARDCINSLEVEK